MRIKIKTITWCMRFALFLMCLFVPQGVWADDRLDKITLNGVTAELSTTGSYEWVVSTKDGMTGLMSSNYHESSSASVTTITFCSQINFTLSFKYAVSSESGFDKLTIKVDDTAVCDAISGVQSDISYTSSTLATGMHTITVSYAKDGGGNGNDDRGYIYDISAVAVTPCTTHTYTTYANKCDVCGLHTHTLPETSDIACTCTTSSQSYCLLCGALLFDGKTQAVGHQWDNDICSVCHQVQLIEATKDGDWFEVSRVGQLYWVAANIKNINYIRLTKDITVNEQVLKADGTLIDNPENLVEWTPIYKGGSFDFDGNGHTISGLYVNKESQDYVGFVGYYQRGSFKKLGIKDSYFKGKNYVGGIVGGRCPNSGSDLTENCYFIGTVVGSRYVGGLVGQFFQAIFLCNCYTVCNVTGNICSGGLIGMMNNVYGYIKNCYTNDSTAFGSTSLTPLCVETGVTSTQFSSGEIAYKLNGSVDDQGVWAAGTGTPVWYQRIGEGGDSYPVLKKAADGSNTVYSGYDGCMQTYANTALAESPNGHNCVNGICPYCGYELSSLATGTLADKSVYARTAGCSVDSLTYTRTFGSTAWASWYVPFAMPVAELGTGVDAYAIENVRSYDDDEDGEADRSVLEVIKVTGGSLTASTPYIIYTREGGDMNISLQNITLDAVSTSHPVVIETATKKYTFEGTYAELAASAGRYAMADNALQTNVAVEPQRIYMTVSAKNNPYVDATANEAPMIRLQVVGEEDYETGIRTLYAAPREYSAEGIFKLNGQAQKSLQKGINIKNGKAVMMK